jgi:hypothetical protein
MLFDLIDLLTRPEAYVCMWRDGELYVEPVGQDEAPTTEGIEDTSNDDDEKLIAA